jgi:hypothetical protein
VATSSTIPDSDAYNWIIAPAGRCVLAVGEGARVGALLHRAMIALANQGPLLHAGLTIGKAAGQDTTAIERLIAEQPGLSAGAQEIVDGDLHQLHTSGIVFLWASLEVAVEDTATLILIRDPTTLTILAASGVRLPANLSNPLTEIDARRIFARFERLSSGSRRVSEAYCHLLETLGLSLAIDQGIHDKLTELNYIRNCILHRGGIVDDRVTKEAPNLGVVAGASLRIGQSDYLSYYDAVGKFALALINAAIKSRHVRIK